MAGDMSFLDRLRGKRTKDIELPNESGKTDPRLKKPDVMGSFGKAAEGLAALRRITGKRKE